MLVVIKGVPVELPDPEAQILLHRGIATLPETSSRDPRTGGASSGTRTPRGPRPGTVSKQHKQSRGSSKKGTK